MAETLNFQNFESPQAIFSRLNSLVNETLKTNPLDLLTGVRFNEFSIENVTIKATFSKRMVSTKLPPLTMLAVQRLFEDEGYYFDGNAITFRTASIGDLKKILELSVTFDHEKSAINVDLNVVLEATCPRLKDVKIPERASEYRSLMGFTSPKPVVYGEVLSKVHDLLHVVKFHEPFRSATVIRAWKVLGEYDLTVRGFIAGFKACPHEINAILEALQKSVYYYGAHFTIGNESLYKVYRYAPHVKEERFIEVYPDRWDGKISLIAEFSFHAKCE